MQLISLLILKTTTTEVTNEYNDWKLITNWILSELLRFFVQIITYYRTCIKVVDNLNHIIVCSIYVNLNVTGHYISLIFLRKLWLALKQKPCDKLRVTE
jgi:hypothetical protein